jgi:hypothetical protein
LGFFPVYHSFSGNATKNIPGDKFSGSLPENALLFLGEWITIEASLLEGAHSHGKDRF